VCFSNSSFSLAARRFHTRAPFVEALATHAKNPAGHRDVKAVVGEFTDQREVYFGRMFSWAKYAAARLRISFSTSSRRAFFRNSASSCFPSLVNREEVERPASASSWASQFRRQDSEIDNSFAIVAIGLTPERARSTARCRNSGGWGAGTEASFLAERSVSGEVSGTRGQAHQNA